MLARQTNEPTDRQKKPSASTMRYYKNPNVLLKKLSCEPSVDFVSRLKRFLLNDRQPEQNSPQLVLLKAQVDWIRSKIDEILERTLAEFSEAPVLNGNHVKTTRMSNNAG